MNVKLRQRQKNDRITLYLDYYHQGQRNYEYLNLYLIPEPEKGRLTKEQKEENRKNLALAEAIRSKRHIEIQNGIYGFEDLERKKGSFIKYMEMLAEKRYDSIGNFGNWDSALKHVKKYSSVDVSFAQINKKWLEGFREYLGSEALTPSHTRLSKNSQGSYLSKVKCALRLAYREGILQRNPGDEVDGIRPDESTREFLTYDELQSISKAECEIPILKRAFLFSCLTGLRWSDVQKLLWSEVQYSKEVGNYIRFRQQKTKGTETQPISEQALNLLGERGEDEERVFIGLKYSAWHNIKLQQWMLRAGVTKTISFHCARHTYATLQLTLGTDIYTVSKLLGHRDLKTTQVYAKVIDERKKEAASRIQLAL